MRWGSSRARLRLACAATVVVIGPLVWFCHASLLPEAYSVVDMGYPDVGGGPAGHLMAHGTHGSHAMAGRSLTSLRADPGRPPDVAVTLTARQQRSRLPSGRAVDGYTLNGQSPGPVVRASVGQLVQVRLVNESVPDGVTLHWHGGDVPAAEDGVAGVTQDQVGVGQVFIYRFVAERAGTFWYHSHQISHQQVSGGLLGALLVTPAQPATGVVDVLALVHRYHGVGTVNGGDLTAPTPIQDTAVLVTAGGRADLEVAMPADGSPVRVHLGGSGALVLGATSHHAPTVPKPHTTL